MRNFRNLAAKLSDAVAEAATAPRSTLEEYGIVDDYEEEDQGSAAPGSCTAATTQTDGITLLPAGSSVTAQPAKTAANPDQPTAVTIPGLAALASQPPVVPTPTLHGDPFEGMEFNPANMSDVSLMALPST